MSALGGFLGGLGGSTIGASIVSLILETKKFDAGLISAKGRLTSATATMEGTTSKFAGIAQSAYLAAGAAAVAFGVKAITSALEAEQAQTKLANSIENSKNVTRSAIPAFNAQAEALRKLTGADDEAILGAQAFLVQMGLTEAQVKQLTPLIVDLSAKLGISLEAAAKAVGKSVNGTTGGLQRMGVVVDKTKAKTDAYGATLDALGAVQGFAAEKADDQPWVLLQSAFEELAESVGKVLLPVIKDAADDLNALIGPIQFLIDHMGQLNPKVEEGTGLFDRLTGALPDFVGESFPVIGALLDMKNNIDAVSQAHNEWQVSQEKTNQVLGHFKPIALDAAYAFGILTDKTDQTRVAIHHFRRMTDADIKKWVKDQAESFADMSLTLSESRTDWRQTANQTVNAARRMARQAVQMKEDLDKLADLKAPTAFKEWLVEQGPGWISGYVSATKRGKDDIEGYWREAANATKGQKGALQDITTKVTGLGAAIGQLPRNRKVDIDVRLNVSSNVPIDDNTINDILSNGLTKHQI